MRISNLGFLGRNLENIEFNDEDDGVQKFMKIFRSLGLASGNV